MLSDKTIVRHLVHICAAKGVEDVIISPGSRNAPLNISFNEHGGFRCRSVPDERCAAFVALGMAQQTRLPAIITCTSGSAALNFAPAISEAYYQRIPLLILTADRPDEWIGQGEGQSIRQRGVYRNYIKADYHLPLTDHKDDLRSACRMVSEAIDLCSLGTPGPVHINIPFREPLYGRAATGSPPPFIYQKTPTKATLDEEVASRLKNEFLSHKKILILCGLLPNDADHDALNRHLGALAETGHAAVLTESTSNLHHAHFLTGIDRLLSHFDKEKYRPDLLVTIGHSFISKKIKLWLREYPPTAGHWHISADNQAQDVFQCLNKHIPVPPAYFFGFIQQGALPSTSNYAASWRASAQKKWERHQAFLSDCPWSDMGAFKEVLPKIPTGSLLHLGNSSPVRYAQLFPVRGDLRHYANRGVSGIDGSTSTAIGAALATGLPTTLVTGDVSFFYDSNAFWQNGLPPQIRIILINNSGGGIFRLIPGPPSTGQLEEFFETHHSLNARGICDTFGIAYHHAASYTELAEALPALYAPQGRPALLELFTPNKLNAKVYKRYFESMAGE